MSVRAICYVEELVIRPGDTSQDDTGPVGVVKLRPAAKGPYQNWARYTPHGSIELGTLNPAAFAWFQERLGRDVAVTFDDPTDADLAVM